MGDVQLGFLPGSRKWRRVVDELRSHASLRSVIALAIEAANGSLDRASTDPAFLHSFWLLTQIPAAARGPAFARDLRRVGIRVPARPSLMDVVAGFSAQVDKHAIKMGGRTDLGEMAQMAAVETLIALVGPNLPSPSQKSLFETSWSETSPLGAKPGDVQRQIGLLASGDNFGLLAGAFFARLTRRCLAYYLSRELGSHIGERFRDDTERASFEAGLEELFWRASRLVEPLAREWYGEAISRDGYLTPEATHRFAKLAFKRVRAELRRDGKE